MSENATYYSDLITRYFCGEITEEELRLLSAWLKSDIQHQELFRQYRETWQLVEAQKIHSTISIDQEWLDLQALMHAETPASEEPVKIITMARNNSPLSVLQHIWKAAAVVTILMAASFLLYFYFSQPSEIIVTAQAENLEQLLPDGSVVSLHAGSQLTYPEKFSSGTRNVELKGEAYFKVAHDKTKPFIVASGNARVEVLGTQFNVNTLTSAGDMEVVLTSGKVSVYYKENPKENVLLLPGEKAELKPEQKQISKSANTDPNYMAWKTRILVFDNETLAQVVNTLQNVYQIPVILSDPQLSGCRVTATFSNQSLQSVLQVIKETLDLQVKQNGKTVELIGTKCR